jgi:hypothetical protein
MFDRDRAKFGYRIARLLLIYGIVGLVASIPLFILTWAQPLGSWVLIYFFSGLIALAAATVLGVLNLIYIRQNAGNPESSKDVK